ncbi:MAG TPA: DMT family transporter [Steroidobacteraceae bacterium]|jgi:drug/metabolite transporter (DMT)-like permease|nr:DMT family transporter [Steroidobacteraceae bacterium]
MQSHLASILMLLVTMVIWGSTFAVTKSVNDQVQPFTLAFIRVAIGAVVLLAGAFVRQVRGGAHSNWSALPWGRMLAMALIGVVVYYAVFNYSLVYTSAAQGALVQSCIPAMTALFAVALLREHASMLRWTGIVLSMVGIVIVFSGSIEQPGSASLAGNFLMFLSAVLWGLYTSMAKRVANHDALQVTSGILAAGALLLVPLAALEVGAAGMPHVTLKGWLGLAYLGAGASGIAWMLYSAALKHVDASEAGVYTNLIPIVGVVTGVLLGEPLSARAVVGGMVVLVGVWLTSRQPNVGRPLARQETEESG